MEPPASQRVLKSDDDRSRPRRDFDVTGRDDNRRGVIRVPIITHGFAGTHYL